MLFSIVEYRKEVKKYYKTAYALIDQNKEPCPSCIQGIRLAFITQRLYFICICGKKYGFKKSLSFFDKIINLIIRWSK